MKTAMCQRLDVLHTLGRPFHDLFQARRNDVNTVARRCIGELARRTRHQRIYSLVASVNKLNGPPSPACDGSFLIPIIPSIASANCCLGP
ncbi:protein of unknown function (plasmid) [Cupriavidus taiwanensis]|uniref:Uncharacterized protein n=1 Tax=Cupriavidus taiwanensis TaxID=164546 RepID=A0A375IWY4_9BURK|nr:protein of unknown function [Cupriavidus taiwanensis]